MNILGRNVVLRAPDMADAETLHRWANDPEIWSGLGGWHFPHNLLSTQRWIESIQTSNLKGHVFCIDAPEIGLIGTANLIDIDWKNRNAFHGMMLGDKDIRGKGYGVDTVMAVMRYAFDELGLERLDGDMIDNNLISIKFYTEKCGWVIEGTKRRWHYRNGAFHDKVMVGVTRDDYRALLDRTNYWSA